MVNKIKRFLVCLSAVMVSTVSGSGYADGENNLEIYDSAQDISGEELDSEKTEKRNETVEDIEFNEIDAKKFLNKIGNIDGLDVYYKDMDSDNKIDEIKNLGELTLVDPKTKKAVATFEKSGDCDEGLLYLSENGRYVLTVSDDLKDVLDIKYIVSSLDSPNIFISSNNNLLTLMKPDAEGIEKTFRYDCTEDEMRIYRDENDTEFAWISDDGKHFLGIYRYGAENDNFKMLVDDRNAKFGLENKKTGYIWWSSPIDATQDTKTTQILVDGLRSSNTMNFGIPLDRNNSNILRSNTDDCKTTVSDTDNGIIVVYDYFKAGFRFPVEYILEDDCLKASLKVSEIEETNPLNIATEMTVLGSFGAASDKEDGYFVIPDGCGALVRFNNNKTMQTDAYNQRVYGSDITAVPSVRGAVAEQIYLPVYGIVKEDNAMLIVADKGDSNANLSVKTSKQSNTSYNSCGFTFVLRGTDTFHMSGEGNQKLTVFEKGDIKSDDIELRYYPISKKDASYVDVAEKYRNYLINEKGIRPVTEAENVPLYIDLFGGATKKKSILGIPITMKTSITDYEQAQEILETLKNNGVDDMVVSYSNWTNDGIKNKVDTDAKPSRMLGGKKNFESLLYFINENDFELYPVSDNQNFYSGNGYYSFTNTAVRTSGTYSRIVSYDRAFGIPDGFKKNMSLLSPAYFNEVFSETTENYLHANLNGISLNSLTTSLYGDYGKNNISRYNAMNILIEGYSEFGDTLSGGILADCANAYALPYIRHVTNVPLTSSRFDIFDEDIPFYQIVLHGLIPYSTTAVNGDNDSEKLLLMAAATGSNLSYDMLYEQAGELKDTEFDIYFYANYKNWIHTATEEYKMLEPILGKVSDSVITDYITENDGKLITTTYSNGISVTVNLEEKTIVCDEIFIDVKEIAERKGLVF